MKIKIIRIKDFDPEFYEANDGFYKYRMILRDKPITAIMNMPDEVMRDSNTRRGLFKMLKDDMKRKLENIGI